jgi:poly-gamma-glutamate synthesis protein (capsule biosynthesis protein)
MNRLFKLAALILLLYIGYTYIKNNNIKYDDIKDKAVEIKDKVKDKVSDYKDDYKTKKNVVNITLAGDLLFEEPFYTAVSKGYSKDKYFSLVKDYFKDDDLSIANMEVVIGNSNMKTSGTGYNFCAPEYIGDLVNTLSFEVLGTANNHSFDRGVDGINSTIDYFKDKTNIKTVGTRKNTDDSFLLYVEKNNIKFGITAYTYGTNQKSNSNRSLINYYKDENGNLNKDQIKKDIEELKNNSDIVIVLTHWGQEFRYEPNKEQKELANYLSGLGVDIVVGSHSHNISPIEKINNTLVYYSLGNFVSHDDDIARTKPGEEEFDNAYQVGMISKLQIIKEEDKIKIDNIKTELVVNYFDKDMNNFIIVPFKDYNEEYEKSHLRYSKGLTREFINNMYNKVIDKEYRYE